MPDQPVACCYVLSRWDRRGGASVTRQAPGPDSEGRGAAVAAAVAETVALRAHRERQSQPCSPSSPSTPEQPSLARRDRAACRQVKGSLAGCAWAWGAVRAGSSCSPWRRSGSGTARSPARLGRCWGGPSGSPQGFSGRQGRGAGCRGHVTGLFTNTGARSEFGAWGRPRADWRRWRPAGLGAAASLVWLDFPRGWHTVTRAVWSVSPPRHLGLGHTALKSPRSAMPAPGRGNRSEFLPGRFPAPPQRPCQGVGANSAARPAAGASAEGSSPELAPVSPCFKFHLLAC